MNYVVGGTVNYVVGGTVNYVVGGTVNYVVGGTVNYVVGGTVLNVVNAQEGRLIKIVVLLYAALNISRAAQKSSGYSKP